MRDTRTVDILGFNPLLDHCEGEDVNEHENDIQYQIEGQKVDDAPVKCLCAKSVLHFQSRMQAR